MFDSWLIVQEVWSLVFACTGKLWSILKSTESLLSEAKWYKLLKLWSTFARASAPPPLSPTFTGVKNFFFYIRITCETFVYLLNKT